MLDYIVDLSYKKESKLRDCLKIHFTHEFFSEMPFQWLENHHGSFNVCPQTVSDFDYFFINNKPYRVNQKILAFWQGVNHAGHYS